MKIISIVVSVYLLSILLCRLFIWILEKRGGGIDVDIETPIEENHLDKETGNKIVANIPVLNTIMVFVLLYAIIRGSIEKEN